MIALPVFDGNTAETLRPKAGCKEKPGLWSSRATEQSAPQAPSTAMQLGGSITMLRISSRNRQKHVPVGLEKPSFGGRKAGHPAG
jgi:hypothetical protein